MIPSTCSNAAIYLRVSLEEQARYGFSIDGQLDALRECCKNSRIGIHDVYIDAGVSGKDIKGRPEIQRLLKDAERGKFDVVVIWRISRLSRTLMDLLSIVDSLKRNNITLYSYNENIDINTSLGQLSLQTFGAVAQLERANIADNVRIAMNQRSKQGIWNAGNNVLGYCWVRDLITNEGLVKINNEEAALVRQIFKWYATEQLGFKAISNRLNQAGHLTKVGNPFSIASVRNILNNRNYIGLVRFNKTEHLRTGGAIPMGWAIGTHESIVDQELWRSVQSILQQRSKPPERKFKRQYPLSGLLKCPRCGSSMIPARTKNERKDGTYRMNFYYRCSAYSSMGPTVCRPNFVRADNIEQWFFNQLQILLSTPFALESIVNKANSKLHDGSLPTMEELKQLEKQIQDLDNQQEKLFRSYELNNILKDDFVTIIREVKHQRECALFSKEKMEDAIAAAKDNAVQPELIRSALTKLRRVLSLTPDEQKKRLLQLLVDKITLPSNRDISQATIHSSIALQQIQITSLTEVV